MLEIRLYPCRRKRFSTASLKDPHAEFFWLSQKVADFIGFTGRVADDKRAHCYPHQSMKNVIRISAGQKHTVLTPPTGQRG
jgi:hypothetical protein